MHRDFGTSRNIYDMELKLFEERRIAGKDWGKQACELKAVHDYF